MTKRLSPFSKEFWIEKKGYSETEAIFKVNSMRPVYKEYWMVKGYTEEESLRLASEVLISNSKKGAKKSSEKSKEEHRKNSVRCVEYWLSRGFSADESAKKVRDIQGTNTIENYMKRYGDEGFSKWFRRNEEWSKQMSSGKTKFPERNAISLRHYNNVEEFIEKMKEKRGMNLFSCLSAFRDNLIDILKTTPSMYYMNFDTFVKYNVPKSQIEIFETNGDDWVGVVKSLIIEEKEAIEYLNMRGRKQSWRMWVGGGLLRSSYEIYFYKKCSCLGLHISGIDGKYPNSNMRYDFKVGGHFIEICPLMETDCKYKTKMEKKTELFGSVLLRNLKEIDEWLENYDGS